ncbi:MAG: acetyltransferase [Chloroflexi bacterium]|nr:acetyltransferase [Chloroflexota bacterium]
MMHQTMSRRDLIKRASSLGVVLCLPHLPTSFARTSFATSLRSEQAEGSHPTELNRPVCPFGAAPETASFIDPTARIAHADHVTLGQHVYIGPFASLLADEHAEIEIGEESNVQDNVRIYGSLHRSADDEARVRALGLHAGVEIAERCILAHGATVKGPAQLGVGGGPIAANPDEHQEVFLSFGCEVDGAILEQNTGVSALARVGPGVRLRSGFTVLPGKNVTTQAEADDPDLGKVRRIVEDDVAFNEAVIEVNVGFAQEYTRMFYLDASSVRGINLNPGLTAFNPARHAPILDPGLPSRVPEFRNRIIGAVYLSDSLNRLDAVMGERISLRADEGDPIQLGHIHSMGDDVIFHALEESDVSVGDNVLYGERVIVHGGGRRVLGEQSIGDEEEPTFIGDEVTLKDQSVVFRSQIARGCSIGTKSAVVNSELPPRTVIPDRVIYLNNAIFGPVEW